MFDFLKEGDLEGINTQKSNTNKDPFGGLDLSFLKTTGQQNTGAGTTAPVGSSMLTPKMDLSGLVGKPKMDTPYMARTGEGTTTMQGVSISEGIKNWKERDRKEIELKKSRERIREKEKIISKFGGQEKYNETFGKFGGPAYNPVLKQTPKGLINTENFDDNISKLQDLGLSNNKINNIWNSMQTKDPMNPKNWGYFEMKRQVLDGYKDTRGKEMEKSLELGRAMFDYSIGGGLEWAGFEDFGKSLRKGGEKAINNVQFSNPMSEKAFELSDLSDLSFWTQSFPALAPFMISAIPIGLGGAMLGTSRASTLGVGTIGKVIGGSIGGAISSRLFESFSEAGGNYADLVSEGYTTEQAGQARGETFIKNMALVFTDAGQFARTFMPIKGSSKLKTLVNLGKIPANAVMEGSEELYQGYIGENAKRKAIGEDPISFSQFMDNPEAWKTFTIGAITGGMFGGVGAIVDQKNMILKELEKNYTNIDNEINKYASEGKDEFIDYINLSVQNGIMSEKFGEAMINQYQEKKIGLEETPEKNLLIDKNKTLNQEKLMEKDFNKETPRFGRSFIESKTSYEQQVEKGSEFIPADVFEKVAEKYADVAEGYYYKGKVHLNDNIPENTVYHEVVHYVKNNIDWKTQADLLNEIIQKRNITQQEVDKFNEIALSEYKTEEEKQNYKPLDLLGYAEEALADGYYMFIQNKPQKWLGKDGKIFNFFKTLFKKSITDNFYKDLNDGKYKSLRYQKEISEDTLIKKLLPVKKDEITQFEGAELENLLQINELINNGAKNQDISIIENGIETLKDFGKNIEIKGFIAEANNMINKIQLYQNQPKKGEGLSTEFSPDLVNNVRLLLNNKNRAKSQETLDKFDSIEANMGTSKTFKNVYDSAKELISQRNLDVTVDELVQRVIDKIETPIKKITKSELLENLEGRKTEIKDVTESDKQFTEMLEIKPKTTIERVKAMSKKQELKEGELTAVAEQLAKLVKKVKITDVANLIEAKGQDLMMKALDFGVKKNMFKKEEADEFKKAIPNIAKREDQAPTGRITPEQRLEIQDMLGFDKLFKGLEDQKIVIGELAEGLKNTDSRLHLVNAPEAKRVKLPFSLMGNKSATFKQILLPMIKKATKQGAEIYIEPYGGAGTVYYFADEMIKDGIKELNINHFDNEKFEVVNAIKDGRLKDIRAEVNEAYGVILNDISEVLAEIPEVKEIMNAYGIEARGQYFKDIAETFFYPEYAKQFFTERPDSKLAIKGELTETFKDWLTQHIGEENNISGKELEDAVDIILNDRSVFENRYPEISKKIVGILDKYYNIDLQKGDYKSALKFSVARHFRQRGDSYQKVVSASSGFQNVIGIKDKMIDGLNVYKDTLTKHGDKINLFNMDGKEFIKQMGETKNNIKTVSYFDPPYIRTTGVYIKNQPKEVQDSLQEYADPTKIDNLFTPLKDTIMMFTNDVNGKYIESLNRMTDRMSKNVIAYKEGTTPTSLLFTKEIEVTPKQVGMSYYSLTSDRFIKDIQKSLEQSMLPKIAVQMGKHLAKFEQHIINVYKDKFGDLTKIQDQVYEGKKAFDKLNEGLEGITSLKDRQKIVSEAKKWMKMNTVTGKDVSKMIDKINSLWIQRNAEIRDMKEILKEAKKSENIDVTIKKEMFDYFNENYTDKKVTGPYKEFVDSIERFEKGGETNLNDFKTYEKYLSDREFNKKINEAKKTSIYDLDLDQLHNLRQTINEYIQYGIDSKKYARFQTETIINNYVEKYSGQAKKLKSYENTTNKFLQKRRIKNTMMGHVIDNVLGFKEGGSKKLLIDVLPPDWVLDEELNIHQLVYDIKNDALGKFRDYQEQTRKEMTDKEKELKISDNGFKKITLYGLSKRGDGKGLAKIFAYLKTIGDPFTKDTLSLEEIKSKVDEYGTETFLSKEEMEMYKFMTSKFEEIGASVKNTKLNVDNTIMEMMDNYFPIKIDIGRNPEKFSGTEEPDITSKKVDLFRTTEPTNGFTEKASAIELIPELDARRNFYTHMEKASYYSQMQEPIKILNEVINRIGAEKLGDLGIGYAKDYVNTLARQGILETNVHTFGRIMAKINRNFQQSVLGYSLQTVLLQSSAVLQTKNVGINIGIQNIPKGFTKERWQFINSKSQLMRHREMREMFGYGGDKWDYGFLEKFNKTGFMPLQLVDTYFAKLAWYNKYSEGIKKGLSDKQAVYEADRDVTKALTNSHFDGKSNFVLKHERGRASFLTMFQTFVSYQFANMYYGGGKVRESISGKYGKYIYTALVLGVLMTAYEEYLRRSVKSNIYGTETEGAVIPSMLGNLIGYVPFLNTFYGVSKFGAPATFSASSTIYKGFADMLEAYQDSEKNVTNTKIINLLSGIGQLFGIAGTSEATRWAKKLFKEAKEKKGNTGGGSIEDLGDLGDLQDLGNINDLGNLDDLGDLGNLGDL